MTSAPPTVQPVPHSRLEDLSGLATGVFMAALGVYLIKSAHAVTGGTAGLSLLLSYGVRLPLQWWLVLVNLPFFALGVAKRGWAFTLRSLVCVVGMSLLTPVNAHLLHLTGVNRWYADIAGNLLCGMGILILFRHRSSLGGFNIAALLIHDRTGWSVGYVQMCFDLTVVLCSLFVADWHTMLMSAVGAAVLNLVLAMNHKPGRYMGM